MFVSEPHHYTLRGRPINVMFLWNDASCWCRIVLDTGENFDVVGLEFDPYDYDEGSAAARVVKHVATNGGNVLEPADSWVRSYTEPGEQAAYGGTE